MYLLDTCVISDILKQQPEVIQRLKKTPPYQLLISAVTVMEIEYGLHLNKERAQKLKPIWELLRDQIQVLTYGPHDAVQTARIRATLRTEGRLIGPYDLLLAGTALAHQLIFVTSNTKEFERITNLQLEDWRAWHHARDQ